MALYSEYLKSCGATPEEIAVLDTPTARRAYDRMEASVVENAAAAKAAKDSAAAYQQKADGWFEKVNGEVEEARKAEMLAKAEAARSRTVIEEMTKRGLIDVAKEMGYEVPAASVAPTPAALDSRYVTNETLLQVAEREGDAIAIAQDIAYEHSRLFPDRPLNFRELRREAVTRKVNVEALWMERYGVTAAREARAKAAQDAHDAKMRDEGRKSAETEFASKYANPDMRPGVVSQHPLAPRPATQREKQPWETGDLSNERVLRATKKVLETQVH